MSEETHIPVEKIDVEKSLFERLRTTWYVENNDKKVLIESLPFNQLHSLWSDGLAENEEDEDMVRLMVLWYVIDKLNAYQDFLKEEGYVQI